MDDEFKRTVAEMKPHAKLLPQKSGEKLCFLNNALHNDHESVLLAGLHC